MSSPPPSSHEQPFTIRTSAAQAVEKRDPANEDKDCAFSCLKKATINYGSFFTAINVPNFGIEDGRADVPDADLDDDTYTQESADDRAVSSCPDSSQSSSWGSWSEPLPLRHTVKTVTREQIVAAAEHLVTIGEEARQQYLIEQKAQKARDRQIKAEDRAATKAKREEMKAQREEEKRLKEEEKRNKHEEKLRRDEAKAAARIAKEVEKAQREVERAEREALKAHRAAERAEKAAKKERKALVEVAVNSSRMQVSAIAGPKRSLAEDEIVRTDKKQKISHYAAWMDGL